MPAPTRAAAAQFRRQVVTWKEERLSAYCGTFRKSEGVRMQDSQVRFVPLAAKTVVCHTITYFFMGTLAYHFLHYQEFIDNPCSGMRPITSLWVILGAPLQIIRGVLFASVFYLLRERLFGQKSGWLRMAWMLIGIGILGTFAAPGGS